MSYGASSFGSAPFGGAVGSTTSGGIATANVTCPFPTLGFTGSETPVAHASVSVSCPPPTLVFTAHDASGDNIATAAVTAPSPTLVFNATSIPIGSATMNLTAPSPRLSSVAHDSYGEQAAFLTAPSPTLAITTGANAKYLRAPGPLLNGVGTSTIYVTADLTAPMATISAELTSAGMANAALGAPRPNLVGYGGAVCSVKLTGRASVQSQGTTGGIGGAQITAPLFQLSASATAQNHGSANLLAPSPHLGAAIQAWLVAPAGKLTAIGSAVITATYEAYAVNLKHMTVPGVEPTNEVTRYTNFPFTHVVRYKGSYYGANSTGLYLLEGTTDDTAPIPFNVKTAMTDFKSPTKKTLGSAYFSGRFGPASTITLTAGEDTLASYSYSTPRDQNAQNYRQAFGRGLKARYYQLAVAGTDTLELDGVELDVHNLARRI